MNYKLDWVDVVGLFDDPGEFGLAMQGTGEVLSQLTGDPAPAHGLGALATAFDGYGRSIDPNGFTIQDGVEMAVSGVAAAGADQAALSAIPARSQGR